MNVDSVITLGNNTNCLLLDKITYSGSNYFLAVALDEEEEPTDEYAVLKEIIEDNEAFVEKVEDPQLLVKFVDLFTYNLADMLDDLPKDVNP